MTYEAFAVMCCMGAFGGCAAMAGICYVLFRRIRAITEVMDMLKARLKRVGEELEEYRVLMMEDIEEDEESD